MEVIFSHDKYEYAVKDGKAAILIDDYEKNVRLYKEHGGHIVHHVDSAKNSLKTLVTLEEQDNEQLGRNGIRLHLGRTSK